MKYGIISGKFRLLHTAHKEYIINALDYVDHLHVVICEFKELRRFASLIETKIAIAEILQKYDTPFTITIAYDEQFRHLPCPGEGWDQFLLDLSNNKATVVFESKEQYGNILLPTQFIETTLGKNISASWIESDPYSFTRSRFIAPEYVRFMNKKVVLTGIESCGKTTMAKRLADFFQTIYSEEYGRFYSDNNLGGLDDCYQPKDFIHIADSQLLQDKEKNKFASRLLIVDTDPIVTLYYLRLYKEEILTNIDTLEYQMAERELIKKAQNYTADLFIYLTPKVKFVADGKRFLADEQKRLIKNQELLNMYKQFNITVHIVDSESYADRFSDALNYIETNLHIKMGE